MLKNLRPGDPDAVGPYRLLGRLGQGGMGQVYLARSPGGRVVAVKVIRPELADEPGFRTRFAREVAAARGVSGMFTALVVDADTAGPVPWLATAYVPAPSLAEAVENAGPLPAQTVLILAAGLAEGLQAIHAGGVVHRDLKPLNVLLAADGPRVIDFGISRVREESMLTQTGTVMGSPGFLSPEQAEGFVVGPPTDIFSLGAVLTYAATGTGPFGTGPTPALMFRVVNRDPDLSRVPETVRPVIERCLVKDPDARPTPAELLAQLDALGAGIGVVTPEWLPAAVTATFAQYVPAAQAPRSPAPSATPPTPAAEPTAPGSGGGQGIGDVSGQTAGEPVGTELEPPERGAALPLTAVGDAPIAPVHESTVDVLRAHRVSGGPATPAGPGGAGATAPRGLRHRRRLILAGAAGLILLAGIGAGVGLSGAGPGKAIGGPNPTVEVSTGSASARPTATPSHSPASRPASAKSVSTRKTHKPARKTGSRPTPSVTTGTTPTQSPASAPTQGTTPTTAAPTTAAPTPKPTHTTAPQPQGISGYSGATPSSCSNYGSIGTTPGGSAVTFTFVNNSGADVPILSIGSNDVAAPYATIPPGGSVSPPSAATDQDWMVENASGGCLSIFVINGSGGVSVS